MDKQLKIKTTGRDDSHATDYNYPYEPTDYRVLERLADSGYFSKRSRLIDYGSGKGRVSFYLTWATGCRAIGVELDRRLYERAQSNLASFVKPYNVRFVCENAVDFAVPMEADRFFFFNPFAKEILRSVLRRIKETYYSDSEDRERLLLFYYPSDEYVAVLMSDPELFFEDEIDCRDLFDRDDPRERILIFRLGEN